MKNLLVIPLALLILSCHNTKNNQHSNCDVFIGTWTFDRTSLQIKKSNDEYIFSYEIKSGPRNEYETSSTSSGQACICRDETLKSEEGDLLTMYNSKIIFRGNSFMKK